MTDHANIDHTGLTGVGGTETLPESIIDAAGDLIIGNGADSATRLAIGTAGQVLTVNAGATAPEWAAAGGGSGYFSRRLLSQQGAATSVTTDVNSTTYLAPFSTAFYHDWDIFPATHFLISAVAQSSAGGATITLQLTPFASATNPVSAAGDDLVITNTLQEYSSGWIAVSDAMSGIVLMALSFKGSTSTVDLATRWVDIAFKY